MEICGGLSDCKRDVETSIYDIYPITMDSFCNDDVQVLAMRYTPSSSSTILSSLDRGACYQAITAGHNVRGFGERAFLEDIQCRADKSEDTVPTLGRIIGMRN